MVGGAELVLVARPPSSRRARNLAPESGGRSIERRYDALSVICTRLSVDGVRIDPEICWPTSDRARDRVPVTVPALGVPNRKRLGLGAREREIV